MLLKPLETFPKSRRLLKRLEFKKVFSPRRRSVGKFFCLDFLSTKRAARLGITAPTKFGSAVQRNRFKRLAREAFRRNQELFDGYDINLFPRRAAHRACLQDIADELKWHFDELKRGTKKSCT